MALAPSQAMSMGLWMIFLVAPIQAVVGDFHGLNTLEHQPAKIAAIEGHWETHEGGTPLILFGWPDMEQEETRYRIEIPNLGSLILTHSWDGKIPSLKDFPPEDRPNSPVTFWSFRIMVGLGILMIALSAWGVWLRWRDKLWTNSTYHRFALCMGPTGLIALLAGWFTTEVGRQPWVVYGLMRTSDGVSAHGVVPLSVTLALFVVIYFAVFGVGLVYMARLVRVGPKIGEGNQTEHGGPGRPQQPMRPLSAATTSDTEPNPESRS